jgi:hypothetical protein
MIQLLVRSLKSRGAVETLGLIRKNVVYETRWFFDRAFDRRFGTNTSQRIDLDALAIGSRNREHGVYYEATPTKVFKHIISNLKVAPYEEFVFVDFGSGKGRTLLLASDFPFKEIVGVEFSPVLHGIAQNNISIYRSRNQKSFNLKSVCVDAVEYSLPNENMLIYFYNPFRGPVMSKVLHNIKKSVAENRKKVILVYYNPLQSRTIEDLGFLTKKQEIHLPYDHTRDIQRRLFVYSNE